MRVRRLVLGSGLLLGAVTFAGAGRLLVREDPVSTSAPADVAYVLGGARVDRWLEAVELYKAGHARHILLSRGSDDEGERMLAAQGISVPTDADVAAQVMRTHLGIPDSAIEILLEPVDNTAHEAEALAAIAPARGWRSVTIITSRSASRRAGHAFQRAVGDHMQVMVRTSRLDRYDPAWWWRHRGQFRETFYEVPKLVAYWLGLGA